MRIQRIQIKNFRNFQHLDAVLGEHAVIVGENKVGKSNFLYALRLILDPSLPDSFRLLQPTDFWEGLTPLPEDATIQIAIDLADFEYSDDLKSVLHRYLIETTPMVARLNYTFRRATDSTNNIPSYEFLVYGADDETCEFGYSQRRWLPLDLLPALRDAEGDLATIRRSPLQPLLRRAAASIDRGELTNIAEAINQSQQALTENEQIRGLAQQINDRICSMVGSTHAIDAYLRLAPTNPDALLRTIRLLIDGGEREIGQASLGSANVLYITLKTLETQQYLDLNERHHTFLAIEEPEAHLHPHVQRSAYRHFLRARSDQSSDATSTAPTVRTILMSTHSPHIASIAPLRSLILLRHNSATNATEAVSTARVNWTDDEVNDLERYLDVTRGEMLFARGIILVEGDAEEFLLPAFGKLLNYAFDEIGITVCSISGVHFTPYIKLLGPLALNIPFAILTDYDPMDNGEPLGPRRVQRLLAAMISSDEYERLNDDQRLERARELGIFMNTHTLEVDLFHSGCHEAMCDTLIELSEVAAARVRAARWRATPESIDTRRALADIGVIGKGRFAQRLASRLTAAGCPQYIREAIEYVAGKCS